MYLRFGALFYPDALISGQHPIVWNLLNTTCRRDEPEFDTGAILVNKKRVWNALYLTKLMNDRHELFYKWV
jgi:alpha 1,2-mannosyltransferase